MPRQPRKPAARKPRSRAAKPAAVAAVPASKAFHAWFVALVLIGLACGAYRFRDRIPQFTRSQDTQLARAAVQRHSQLLISEIIVPLRQANDGTLTAERTLAKLKTAHPVIDRHTWSPLADRLTQLQASDKDGKPTGLMDREALARFLDDCEAGIR